MTWNRPDDARVTGYKIFYRLVEVDYRIIDAETDFKSISPKIIKPAENTSCDISGLNPGQRYGFAAKSIDDKGNESDFSEVLHYDVPKKPSGDGGGGGGCFIHFSGL